MDKVLNDLGLVRVWSKIKENFAAKVHTHPDATLTESGFMSPSDKTALENTSELAASIDSTVADLNSAISAKADSSEITDIETRLLQIEQIVDDIPSEVSGNFATADDLEAVQDEVQAAQSDIESANLAIAELKNSVDNSMQFDKDSQGNITALTLNVDGSTNKIVVGDTSTQFMYEGSEVARVDENGITFSTAIVTDSLQTGNWVWIVRSNGNLSLKWIGE